MLGNRYFLTLFYRHLLLCLEREHTHTCIEIMHFAKKTRLLWEPFKYPLARTIARKRGLKNLSQYFRLIAKKLKCF